MAYKREKEYAKVYSNAWRGRMRWRVEMRWFELDGRDVESWVKEGYSKVYSFAWGGGGE
jgi:hypothetical protein